VASDSGGYLDSSKRPASAPIALTEARCSGCNGLQRGRVVIQKVCERCKRMNVFTLSST
jgi:hypothetical protein